MEMCTFKVDFIRGELHREIEVASSLTDMRVVVLSQMLDEFIVEKQRILMGKSTKKIARVINN